MYYTRSTIIPVSAELSRASLSRNQCRDKLPQLCHWSCWVIRFSTMISNLLWLFYQALLFPLAAMCGDPQSVFLCIITSNSRLSLSRQPPRNFAAFGRKWDRTFSRSRKYSSFFGQPPRTRDIGPQSLWRNNRFFSISTQPLLLRLTQMGKVELCRWNSGCWNWMSHLNLLQKNSSAVRTLRSCKSKRVICYARDLLCRV